MHGTYGRINKWKNKAGTKQMKCMNVKQKGEEKQEEKNEICEITAKEGKSTMDGMVGDFDEFR